MALHYSSKDGDMLDWICWSHYGQHAKLSDAARQIEPHLLEANHRLDENVQVLSQFNPSDLRGIVEQVLDANPGLANIGTVLPSGIQIYLPDISARVESTQLVQLWDD